jgi:hypothetical protein
MRSQEEPGGSGRSQEEPGGAKTKQEQQRRVRRSWEEPGGARISKQKPGGARKSQIKSSRQSSVMGSPRGPKEERHLCHWGGSPRKTGSRGEIFTLRHPVLRSGLRSALGKGPAEGYQTGSQVLPWGVGTEVFSRACMSEAGGRSGCGAGWPSLVGCLPTGHHVGSPDLYTTPGP